MNRAMESPRTHWHGFPRTLDRTLALAVADALERIWRIQAGTAKSRRDGLTRWFDPVATGARLRKQLAELGDAPLFSERVLDRQAAELVTVPFVVEVSRDQLLLTAEGLELLDILRQTLAASSSDLVSLPWSLTDEADDRALEFYRGQTIKRLQSVIELQHGGGRVMLPASIGQVLFLLLNGNVGADKGLLRPDDRALGEVDQAIAKTTRTFVDALDHRDLKARAVSDGAFSLYSGYGLTEARRRLSPDLTIDPIGVAAGARERVIDRLAMDLARRPDLTEAAVRDAVIRLADAYDAQRPVLAAHGLANGVPGRGVALAEDVVDRFRYYRGHQQGAADG